MWRLIAWMASAAIAATIAAAQTAPEGVLREGLTALQRNDVESARRKLEQATAADPADPRGWLGLAQARRLAGDEAGAEEAIEEVLQTEPKEPWLAHMLAMYYAESREFDRAAEFESLYARSEPDDRDVFLRTAVWQLEAGRADLAVEFARSGLEREPRPELYTTLGQALGRLGRIDEGEEALREAIRLRPYDEEYRYNLGYLFLQAGRFDEAVAAFEEGRAVFDKSPRLEIGVGVARFGQRRFDEAVDAFLRVSALAPGLEQPHYFLSRALEHSGDRLDEVTARFEAFERARPGHYLAPFFRAKALLAGVGPRAGEEPLRQAEALLAESIRLRGDFWESHFERGVALDRMRRYEEAETELLRAITLSPQSPTPHYRLSRVYSRLGKRELAEKEVALHAELVARQRDELGLGGSDLAVP